MTNIRYVYTNCELINFLGFFCRNSRRLCVISRWVSGRSGQSWRVTIIQVKVDAEKPCTTRILAVHACLHTWRHSTCAMSGAALKTVLTATRRRRRNGAGVTQLGARQRIKSREGARRGWSSVAELWYGPLGCYAIDNRTGTARVTRSGKSAVRRTVK